MQNNFPYEDILHHSRPASLRHRPMSMIDRAAQFSPFAALVGYDAQIEEASRLTGRRIELDESEKYILDLQQNLLLQQISAMPSVAVTYFCPDDRKTGGKYIQVTGRLKKILPHEDVMILSDGTAIPLSDVIGLESPVFEGLID